MVFVAILTAAQTLAELKVSIPDRGLWFLWLIDRSTESLSVIPFQSLIGVYGFCGQSPPCREKYPGLVSIPDRGLWFLWLETGGTVVVSTRFNP